jgi:hypothetical protein
MLQGKHIANSNQEIHPMPYGSLDAYKVKSMDFRKEIRLVGLIQGAHSDLPEQVCILEHIQVLN